MRVIQAGLIALVICISLPAIASNGADFGSSGTSDWHASSVSESGDPPYNAALAVILPIAATSLSLVTMAKTENPALRQAALLSFVAAPDAGKLYARNWSSAIVGSSLRAVGVGMIMLGTRVGTAEYGVSGRPDGGTLAMVFGGAGLIATSTIYSIISTTVSAAHMQSRHRHRLSIGPAPIRGPGRSTGWGGQLSVQF